MEDVAARAGVSTATVSRALRGLPHVAEATRQRVLAAADELDYVISPTASRLATGRTTAVGVVVPFVGRWFFGQVIAGAEAQLRANGLDLLLFVLPDLGARERFFADLPLRRRVDAVLTVALPLHRDELDALRGLDVPLAFVGGSAPGVSSVRIDEVAGARVAVQHLVNLGHERIAMIGGGEESAAFSVPSDRRQGYRAALRAGGLPIDPRLEVAGGYTPAGGEQAMADLLAMPDRATAVFVQSDEMALGAIRAVRRAGLRCPGDVSIVGFDGHELAEYTDLTTVVQPVRDMGERAGRILSEVLAGGAPTVEVVPTHLVIRGTTGPPSPAPGVAAP
jgi:DNA-binding LacI/PurR family transcriptional regulator